MTSNSRAEGRFDRQDFIYVAEDDEYRCPAGERAIRRFTTFEAGLTIHKYWSSACTRCPIKARCTTGDYRRITRWEHEAVLDAMQERLDRQPDSMRVRRRTVEQAGCRRSHYDHKAAVRHSGPAVRTLHSVISVRTLFPAYGLYSPQSLHAANACTLMFRPVHSGAGEAQRH
jgi:hypothetical protein